MNLIDVQNSFRKHVDSAFGSLNISIVGYFGDKLLWQGTVIEFCETPIKDLWKTNANIENFMVLYYGHPAITVEDEKIPEYCRNIVIRVF